MKTPVKCRVILSFCIVVALAACGKDGKVNTEKPVIEEEVVM